MIQHALSIFRADKQYKLADWVEENIEECLTVIDCPPEAQRRLRTSNIMMPAAEARITPPNWTRHWRELRGAAQLHPWRPDTLRHSFASYHCRHFQNLTTLQLEMGHSDQRLLQARYINLRGLTAQAAAAFWSPGFLQSSLKRR